MLACTPANTSVSVRRRSASKIARSTSAGPKLATSGGRPAALRRLGVSRRRRCVQPESGGLPRRPVVPGGHGERPAQLVEIILVGQRRVLVEPLGRQDLGRPAGALTPVCQPDARPDEALRRLGQRHHAEAKRHAQHDGPLEKVDLDQVHEWRFHAHANASMMPRMNPAARAAQVGPSGW